MSELIYELEYLYRAHLLIPIILIICTFVGYMVYDNRREKSEPKENQLANGKSEEKKNSIDKEFKFDFQKLEDNKKEIQKINECIADIESSERGKEKQNNTQSSYSKNSGIGFASAKELAADMRKNNYKYAATVIGYYHNLPVKIFFMPGNNDEYPLSLVTYIVEEGEFWNMSSCGINSWNSSYVFKCGNAKQTWFDTNANKPTYTGEPNITYCAVPQGDNYFIDKPDKDSIKLHVNTNNQMWCGDVTMHKVALGEKFF